MKNSILKLGAKYMAIGGLLAMCSCSSGLEKDLPQAKPISRQFAANTLTITAGMDLAGINGILRQAQSGDVIEVEGGVYAITGKLELKDGITLKKQAGTAPVFSARSKTDEMLEQDWNTGNNNVIIQGIIFHNIRFKIENASNTSFSYCIFDYGVRKAGTNKWNNTNDAYIQIVGSKNMKVESCVFKRRMNNSGRGVFVKQSNHTKITKNNFGATDDTAYFVTAINDNSTGTLIEDNTIKRNVLWVNKDETDHGIYAHSFDGLMIKNNTISGWPANGEGGAVKARNGKNLTITGNIMNDSGIILNVYNNLSANYLENVVVQNNTITLAGYNNDIYSGIGYWKNTSDTSFYEKSIKIDNNTLINGAIKITPSHLNITSFNENGGGVHNNTAKAYFIAAGIDTSGNITN
ncbi:right-handed parallel beta-helix repeat-containing protein [Tenacibaculum maritimum]|nr:right-handed parallel beta-helix repeat-containing protein [Tenacibaculum maritimum]MDB0599759.1 right-handed parallel beta-helix repeat-containing protein [Tenacibaculum maritimum]MDB0611327.1 right-handed parallel beta-helix repeat-containing protein [Tenacibaculum maritimum]